MRYEALENFYMVKEAAKSKKSLSYDRDKLRTDTQRHLGRVTGGVLGSFAGGMGKTPAGVLATGLGGAALGAGAGHLLGPKVFKISDDTMDFSVDQAIKHDRKKVLKNLREEYGLKSR